MVSAKWVWKRDYIQVQNVNQNAVLEDATHNNHIHLVQPERVNLKKGSRAGY